MERGCVWTCAVRMVECSRRGEAGNTHHSFRSTLPPGAWVWDPPPHGARRRRRGRENLRGGGWRGAGEAAGWGLGATPWCGDPAAGRRRVLQQETRQTLGTRVPAAASQSLLSPGPHRTDHRLPSPQHCRARPPTPSLTPIHPLHHSPPISTYTHPAPPGVCSPTNGSMPGTPPSRRSHGTPLT